MNLRPLLIASLCSIGTCLSAQSEAAFLTGTRQLTFEGRRSGEGYFSADGAQMIFQSEREAGNPFYQIYLMDLATGDQERVSPGVGKTTCAWIHPDGKRVMFASTHLDAEAKAKQVAEIKERETNRVRRYSWDYDETFDLFEYSLADKSLKPLTTAKGYDAEGCYAPDGQHIVFASNRAAYATELSKADAERLKTDKQFFMDLYLADADGSNVKRLTDVPGYDGGPFFSADGTKICWRRFDDKGEKAEIYVMNADGTGQHPITHVGAMSWAPYWHPSGRYLIFTNNVNGFANFELYIVDAEGKHEPVRVTSTDGFDGLPVFSPNGKQLAWTSARTADAKSQIFIADWADAAALKALGLDASAAPGKVIEAAHTAAPDLATTAAEITAADLRTHITYLASDALNGRLTGTPGEILATQYAADVFAAIGLSPEGDKDSFFQPFNFTAGVALGSGNALDVMHGGDAIEKLQADKDWRPLSFSQTGKIAASEVVFVGYGIETPEEAIGSDGKKMEAYSSYAHAEVKGKWVLALRYLPEDVSKERRDDLAKYSSLRHKALIARQRGALGLLIVSGPNSKVVEQLVPMAFDASLASSGIPAISLTDAAVMKWFEKQGKSLKDIQTSLDKGDLMQALPIPGVTLAATIDIQQETRVGRNVIARLCMGSAPDYHGAPLIIGAHIDHLGNKGGANSRAKGDEADKIHHGADDNASGVGGMFEIAQWLAAQKKAGKLAMKRDIIFAAWSGEEIGLLGSSHFINDYAKAITGDVNATLKGMIAANLNMDMIGRMTKTVVMQGAGSSSIWAKEVEQRNAAIGLPVTLQSDAHLPTDSTTFYTRGIPTLNAFTGSHADYHTPGDTSDKINYEGAEKIAKLMGLIARGIVTTDKKPDFIEMAAPKNAGTRGGMRVYLGTIPDYAQGDIKGVKLSGVSPVGPAAKAGVKAGDVIVKLGSKDVLNIYDYTAIMGELKVGAATTITVLREGKPLELKLTPGSRD
jgi:Tol biopolymer transport system component